MIARLLALLRSKPDAWASDWWRRRLTHNPHYQGRHRSGIHHAG